MNINVDDVRRSVITYRYNYRKSTIVAQVISCVILALTSWYLIANYLSPIKTSIWNTSKYTFEQRTKTIFLLLGILFFILSIVVIIKVPAIKKSFLCITENGVYGTGGKSFYFATISFTIPADQITNVTAKGNSIVIESGGNKYQCIIEDAAGAASQLTELIWKNKNTPNNTSSSYNIPKNSTNYITCPTCGESNSSNSQYCFNCRTYLHKTNNQNNNNIWICPKCGKENQSYVGTCGCGELKPRQ